MNYILSVQGVTVRVDVNEFILLSMNWDLAKPNITLLFVHVKRSSHSLFFVNPQGTSNTSGYKQHLIINSLSVVQGCVTLYNALIASFANDQF